MHESGYPFAAIVGQESVKSALIYNLINPRIGGVLLCGEKGTGKSTIVRGLGDLSGRQVIELPLNATEDRLIGAVDFEAAMKTGTRELCAGVLARAHGNILYVDEVNLLSDGLATAVIVAASAGENRIEREGISHCHDCQFILIGSMNLEEGGLRPQLLDRFGLFVYLKGEAELKLRAEVIQRRLAYERNPTAFRARFQAETEQLTKKIQRAQAKLANLNIDETVRQVAAQFAHQAGAAGNRCELLLVETASAVAAFDGRQHITVADLQEAAAYVLPHRLREAGQPVPDQVLDSRDSTEAEPEPCEHPAEDQPVHPEPVAEQAQVVDEETNPEPGGKEPDLDPAAAAPKEQLVRGEETYAVISLPVGIRDRITRKGIGHRQKTQSKTSKGRYAGFTQTPLPGRWDLAFDATLRAAAPYQNERSRTNRAVAIEKSDLRFKKRENHTGATIVFVVDASGSMGALGRMKATKEAILSLLLDAYHKRDKIGLVVFKGDQAEVLLQITSSADLAEKALQELPTGGRTPLAEGIHTAWQLLRARRLKDPEMLPLLVLVTDGRANSAFFSQDPIADAHWSARLIARDFIPAVVVDTEHDYLSFQLAKEIANTMQAAYFKVDSLKGRQLTGLVFAGQALLMANQDR